MIIDAILTDWVDRCRQFAQLAREDVQRSAAFETLTDPDATVRLVHRDDGASPAKS